MLASSTNQTDIIKLLFLKGAQPNVKDMVSACGRACLSLCLSSLAHPKLEPPFFMVQICAHCARRATPAAQLDRGVWRLTPQRPGSRQISTNGRHVSVGTLYFLLYGPLMPRPYPMPVPASVRHDCLDGG